MMFLRKFSLPFALASSDFNMALFLIVSQKIRHEFCTDVTHLKFFSKNFMARSYADAHIVSNFLDS